MTSPTGWFRRTALFAAVLAVAVGWSMPAPASAATRLFVAANELGEIWEINPTTGAKIAVTTLVPQAVVTRCGLAYDGTYLYYTDETLAVVQAYVPGGALDHTLPKPAGPLEPGSGLGANTKSVFLVGLDGSITEIDSTTGAVKSSFTIPGAQHGLTFAGSRSSLFVVVNDSTTVKELALDGSVKNTITADSIFRGLAFSSSSGILYGVRGGTLTAVDPATGATLAGYPVQIHDATINLLKTGGAAADEPVLEFCGDEIVNVGGETCDPPGATQTNGQLCRQDCTYCGDGTQQTNEQCDDGNDVDTDDCRNDCTLPSCGDGILDPGEQCDFAVPGTEHCSETCQNIPYCGDGTVQPDIGEQCEPPNTATCDANCHAFEICLNLIDDDGDGAIDCLDSDCDCLPIGRDPGAIRFGRSGQGDLLAVHGSLSPATAIAPSTEEIKIILTNANGAVYSLVIPAGDVKQLSRNLFRFRNKLAQRNRSGLARFDVRFYPKRNNYTFVLKTYGDLSKATLAQMGFQLAIGDDGFLNQSTWQSNPKGWVLSLPGE
jgi:cysteine-rich repeat protein